MAHLIAPEIAIPFAKDEFMTMISDLEIEFKSDYFIFARTISGGRMYSEDFSVEQIQEYMDKYRAVVKYFGGGEIILYRSFGEDCEVVKRKKIY